MGLLANFIPGGNEPLPVRAAAPDPTPSEPEPSDDGVEVLRVSDGQVDLEDPDLARGEAEAIVARAAQGPAQAAIGTGVFNAHFGEGAMEALAKAGLFVFKARQQGHSFLFCLAGRDAQGKVDSTAPMVHVCDAGTNVQVKQQPPSPAMLARALVETARLKGWSVINVESDSKLADEVRAQIALMGMPVLQPGAGGALVEPRKPRAAPPPGMG